MRKPGPPRDIPPPLELECLKALWEVREGSVKDVRDAVNRHKQLAYTTVMTVLERLVRRGSAQRRKVGRVCVYTPSITRDALRRAAVRDLADSFFDGSEAQLAAFLAGRERVEEAPAAKSGEAADETASVIPPAELDASLL